MNDTQGVAQMPDMNALGDLLGGMQTNKKPEEPDNSKPKTYEEYKKEKKEKKKKEQNEKEYKAFKQSMKRAEQYLKKFDKAKLSDKDKKKIEDLKKYANKPDDLMGKITHFFTNLPLILDRLVDMIFSVAFFGFAGIVAEQAKSRDRDKVEMILKNKMGIKLKGKDKEMFDRYQQEKQQEAKEKEEKKKEKKQKKQHNNKETQLNVDNNRPQQDSQNIKNNSPLQPVKDEIRQQQQSEEKTTFLDNLLAMLNNEKQQQVQQQKQEKEQAEKQPGGDNKQTFDTTNVDMSQAQDKENTKPLLDTTNNVVKTDKPKMDVNKLLNKKQEQSKDISNNINNQLENTNQINKNNNEITEEKCSDGNDKNNDALKQKNDTKIQEQQKTQNPKMMFNMEQKHINNTIPNNKQNTTKVGLK